MKKTTIALCAYISLLFLPNCTTMNLRTHYQPDQDNGNGGYQEKPVRDKVWVVRFSANANTPSRYAKSFALFRAIEVCKEHGENIAKILLVANRTKTQTIHKTSSYSYRTPTTLSGNVSSNSFGSLNSSLFSSTGSGSFSGEATGGDVYSNSASWDEKAYYPVFETLFICVNNLYVLGCQFKPISSEDMKPFVKDLMGGAQITEFSPDSPSKDTLRIGDIITKVNGVRVQDVITLTQAINDLKTTTQRIKLQLIREGKVITVHTKTQDSTAEIKEKMEYALKKLCLIKDLKSRPICLPASPSIPEVKDIEG